MNFILLDQREINVVVAVVPQACLRCLFKTLVGLCTFLIFQFGVVSAGVFISWSLRYDDWFHDVP